MSDPQKLATEAYPDGEYTSPAVQLAFRDAFARGYAQAKSDAQEIYQAALAATRAALTAAGVAPQEPLGDLVFRAAAAIAETQARRQNLPPEVIQGVTREHMQDAKAALTAAGVAPQPVVDEAALAEVIADAPHSGDPNVSCLAPRCKAAAVAAWLREGVAPQEPSQTETKSGNNFVSLDHEKVAEVLLANAKSRYGGLLFEERAAARIAHALCEAYTEERLT